MTQTDPDRDELDALLALGWSLEPDGKAMTKSFRFRDFVEAFGWMTRVAIQAEKMNHHPDWTNIFRSVDVRLTTHDTGGLSQNDIALARIMEQEAG